MPKKEQIKDSKEKLELAKAIASNSEKVVQTYENFENNFVYFVRRIFGTLNKVMFDSKFSKLAALIIAIIIYITVNTNNNNLNVTQASEISGIPVQIVYNSEIYEISGIPETADVIVTGDMSDITLQKAQVNSVLTADLTGLTEGVHTVKLTPTNFISRLTVNVLNTPSVTVTIKKKTVIKMNISHEFINTKAMSSVYSLGNVSFDQTEVLIRASQDTIEQIAFVKALIDVSDVKADFTRTATLAAYNQQGERVVCDIFPDSVTASVKVSSPNKEVPVVVRPIGTLPNNLSIESITLDYSKVTIYAPINVLDIIDAFYVDLDVSGIAKNTTVSTALTVPSGANSISVTKVNMEVSVAPTVSKTIEGVKLMWVNNQSSYKFSPTNADDATLKVTVTGTETNVNKISANDISVNIDLTGIKPGVQEIDVKVVGNNNYLKYSLADGRKTIEIQVVE